MKTLNIVAAVFSFALRALLPSDDSTELHSVRPRAVDAVAAGRLWQLSEQLTGVSLD